MLCGNSVTHWPSIFKVTLWGHSFELPIIYQCYEDEDILDTQRQAFDLLSKAFSVKKVENCEKDTPPEAEVKPNAFVVALDALKQYIRDDDMAELPDPDIPNIFRYVVPTDVFLPHKEGHRIAAILCDYRLEDEHGLAIVFEDGIFKKLGAQDIVC